MAKGNEEKIDSWIEYSLSLEEENEEEQEHEESGTRNKRSDDEVGI